MVPRQQSLRRADTYFAMDSPDGGQPRSAPVRAVGHGHPETNVTPTSDRVEVCAASTHPPPLIKMLSSPPASPAGVRRTDAWNNNSSRSGEETSAPGPMERKRSGNGAVRAAPEADFMERQVRHRMRKAVGSVAGLVIDEVGVGEPEDEDTFVVPQLAPTITTRQSRSTSQAPGARGRSSTIAPNSSARGRSVSIATRNGTGSSLFGDGGGGRGFGPTSAAGAAASALGPLAENDQGEFDDEDHGGDSRIIKPEGYHRFNRVSANTDGCSLPKRRSTMSMASEVASPMSRPTRRSTVGREYGQAPPTRMAEYVDED